MNKSTYEQIESMNNEQTKRIVEKVFGEHFETNVVVGNNDIFITHAYPTISTNEIEAINKMGYTIIHATWDKTINSMRLHFRKV